MIDKTDSEEMILIPKWEYEKLKGYLKPQKEWQDRDDELTEAIDELHPCETGDHQTYTKAMELIGNRHSKGSLVCLVNYFLAREKQLKAMQERVGELKELVKIQKHEANQRDADQYSIGMANGLILSLATLNNINPKYVEVNPQYIKGE